MTAILLEDHPRVREVHFDSCNDEFAREFLTAVTACDFFCHSVVLNKAKLCGKEFKDKNLFYKYAAGLVFEHAKKRIGAVEGSDRQMRKPRFRDQLGKYLKNRSNARDNADQEDLHGSF